MHVCFRLLLARRPPQTRRSYEPWPLEGSTIFHAPCALIPLTSTDITSAGVALAAALPKLLSDQHDGISISFVQYAHRASHRDHHRRERGYCYSVGS